MLHNYTYGGQFTYTILIFEGNQNVSMVVIGLTGSICTGKSTVSQFLASLGATVLNADKIGHEAFEKHTDTWQQVVDVFGQGILKSDDEVDRQKLGEIVFNDKGKLDQLNDIMHPAMYRMAEKRIDEINRRGVDVIVLEAPLLVEAGWIPLVDQVWVTVARESTMIHRCYQRNGLSEGQALARIHSQISVDEKLKYADVVIDTDCSMSEVENRVKYLWGMLHKDKLKDKIRQSLNHRNKKHANGDGLTSAAVLLPIYERAGEYFLVVTKRSETVNDHKGQISFPGGGRHRGDKSLRDTALRESWEEIGLNPDDVEMLGELDDIVTITTGYIISPFVGIIPYPYEFKASPGEVEEIIEIPMSTLLDETNFREEVEVINGRYITGYSYKYQEWVIWGATAKIIKQFLDIVF